MKPTVTVNFDPDLTPQIDTKPRQIAACCGVMAIRASCQNGCCAETWCCAGHPQILIRNGKVVGTSA